MALLDKEYIGCGKQSTQQRNRYRQHRSPQQKGRNDDQYPYECREISPHQVHGYKTVPDNRMPKCGIKLKVAFDRRPALEKESYSLGRDAYQVRRQRTVPVGMRPKWRT